MPQWKNYNDKTCFRKTDDMMTFSQGQRYCQQFSSTGSLAIIQDKEVEQFLIDSFGVWYYDTDVWIGLRQKDGVSSENFEQDYQWVDGSAPKYKAFKYGGGKLNDVPEWGCDL